MRLTLQVKKVVDGKTAAEGSEGSAAQQVPKDYYVIHRWAWVSPGFVIACTSL